MVGPATNRNGVKPEFAIDASYLCDELGQKFGRDKISSIFCAEDDVSELQGVGVRHRVAIARPGFRRLCNSSQAGVSSPEGDSARSVVPTPHLRAGLPSDVAARLFGRVRIGV